MFDTCKKHLCGLLNTFKTSDAFGKHFFLDFWQIFGVVMSNSVIFGFKIASEAMQIKIPGAVLFVSVVWTRDYVHLKTLMLQNILNTHIM